MGEEEAMWESNGYGDVGGGRENDRGGQRGRIGTCVYDRTALSTAVVVVLATS